MQESRKADLYLWYALGYQTVVNKEQELVYHVSKPKQQMKLNFRKKAA